MSELEADYSRKRSSGSGTETAYTVEARYDFVSPIKIGDQIFDNRWREVHFVDSVIGVPRCSSIWRETLRHGLLSYPAAQALRWWLHAQADAEGHGGLCLESRLVKHQISYSHNIEAVSAHELISGEDRSNCIPDWGKKP